MDTPWQGRVALITGCGRENGIGFATATRLAEQGVAVALADVTPHGAANSGETADEVGATPGLDALVARLVDRGHRAVALYGDVSVPGTAAELVGAVGATLGAVDILVNNAAAPQGEDRNLVEETPDTAFDLLVGVNLYGTFQMTREVIPSMREAGWGRIVNVASIYGRRGTPRAALYGMTKAGVLALTRSTGVEVAPYGITVNAVCPGYVATSRVESAVRRRGLDDTAAWLASVGGVPAGRTATPADVAGAVAYLASPEAEYVTGQEITVDGGLLAM